MQFDFFVNQSHDDFYARYGGDTAKPHKAAFVYLVGSSKALRRQFGAYYDTRNDRLKPDVAGGLSGAEYALLEIASEVLDSENTCSFIDNFLRLDALRRRAVVEALAQIDGTTAD